MSVFAASLQSMVFLLGIGGVGFYILARKIVGENVIQVLSPLALLVAVPCLIFNDVVVKFNPVQTPQWRYLVFVWLGFTLASLPLCIAAGFLVGKRIRREFTVSLFYPNAIFVPLAVLSGVFGPQSLHITELFLLTLFFPAFLFNTFDLFFPVFRSGAMRLELKKVFHPVVIATVLAVFIRLANWQDAVPGFVLRIAENLGNMALPLIMLVIGGSIYLDFKQREKVHWKAAALFVACKNLVIPAVTLLFIWLVKPPSSIALLLFLQSAVPPVTAVPVLTAKAGGNASVTNQFMIGSFAVSVVSIPAGMLVINLLYPGLF
jgi:predicted permease